MGILHSEILQYWESLVGITTSALDLFVWPDDNLMWQ